MNYKIKSCLIIENDSHFSETLGSKLEELDYDVKILWSIEQVIKITNNFDLVLVSLNFKDELYFFQMINKFKNSIVIMMTPYVDYGCFSKAVNLGANDYILKPFKMESLIQKISIFQKKKEIEIREKRLAKFITTVLKEDKNLTFDFDITLPVIICSNLKKNVDLYVFSYSRYLNIDFEIICFDDLQKYKNTDSNLILYLRDYSTLTKKEQKLTLEITKNMNIIIFSNIDETAHGFHNITIKAGSEKINFDKILTINDYIQEVIIQNQDSFPDTELSKALGISRKSLWEKRKKFDIHKERKLKRINDK